jgi:hypothetical protein
MMQYSSNYANILIYENNKNSGGVSSLQKFILVNSQSTPDFTSTGTLCELDGSNKALDDGFFAVTKKENENLDLQLYAL